MFLSRNLGFHSSDYVRLISALQAMIAAVHAQTTFTSRGACSSRTQHPPAGPHSTVVMRFRRRCLLISSFPRTSVLRFCRFPRSCWYGEYHLSINTTCWGLPRAGLRVDRSWAQDPKFRLDAILFKDKLIHQPVSRISGVASPARSSADVRRPLRLSASCRLARVLCPALWPCSHSLLLPTISGN